MEINQFDYTLPAELIAQYPLAGRADSRLLYFNSETRQCQQQLFSSLDTLLDPGDMVVVNDTKVLPARIQAVKPSGGKVEIMLERLLGETKALVQLRSNKTVKPGQMLLVADISATVVDRQDRFFIIEFPAGCDVVALFNRYGAMPLPPYVKRAAVSDDQQRYQTVFAEKTGAVAAPTAGLHFDQSLIKRIKAKGVDWQTITLHVGAGTFLPVQTDSLDDHTMHAERVTVSAELCDAIRATKAGGGKIVAIGTTVVRALETASRSGDIAPFDGETTLFIKPGFEFHTVDRLVTNFHLPKSTLLVLVSAFAGYDRVMTMYQYAITQRFRFFSYGDAMLLERAP